MARGTGGGIKCCRRNGPWGRPGAGPGETPTTAASLRVAGCGLRVAGRGQRLALTTTSRSHAARYRVSVIIARDLTIEAGIRTLISGASLNLQPGDKVGLVGRNGAGKTTLMRTLAGELNPADGHLARSGNIGYLSQESALPELDNPDLSALERVLTARDIGGLEVEIEEVRRKMAVEDGEARDRLIRRYDRLQVEFETRWRLCGDRRGQEVRRVGGHRNGRSGSAGGDDVGRPAAEGRTRPGPVPGNRHAAARRADQPHRPRCESLADGLAGGIPGRANGGQPRHAVARRVHHLRPGGRRRLAGALSRQLQLLPGRAGPPAGAADPGTQTPGREDRPARGRHSPLQRLNREDGQASAQLGNPRRAHAHRAD